jgi:hypothetical protein
VESITIETSIAGNLQKDIGHDLKLRIKDMQIS